MNCNRCNTGVFGFLDGYTVRIHAGPIRSVNGDIPPTMMVQVTGDKALWISDEMATAEELGAAIAALITIHRRTQAQIAAGERPPEITVIHPPKGGDSANR